LDAKNGFTPDDCEAVQCMRAELRLLPLKRSRKLIEGALEAARLKKEPEKAAQRVVVSRQAINQKNELPPPIIREAESRRRRSFGTM
jgi:hypothetical protein